MGANPEMAQRLQRRGKAAGHEDWIGASRSSPSGAQGGPGMRASKASQQHRCLSSTPDSLPAPSAELGSSG